MTIVLAILILGFLCICFLFARAMLNKRHDKKAPDQHQPKKGRPRFAMVLLSCALVACCFTTACQGAPPKASPSASPSPSGSASEAPAAETAQPSPTAALIPARYTAELDAETLGFTFSADAPIDAPSANALPVYHVTKTPFTQDEIDRVKQYFIGDVQLYDTDTSEPIGTELQLYGDTLTFLDAYAKTPDKELVFLYVANDYLDAEHKNINSSMISFRYKGDRSYSRAYENMQAEGISTTPEQAQAIVEQALAGLGLDYMEVLVVWSGPSEHSDKQGYAIFAGPILEGAPAGLAPLVASGLESAYFCVDDLGISSFSWGDKTTLPKRLAQDAALLPFPQISKTFEQNVEQNYKISGSVPPSTPRGSMSVENVRLEYVPRLDNSVQGAYRLVPAWSFHGQSDLGPFFSDMYAPFPGHFGSVGATEDFFLDDRYQDREEQSHEL